MGDVLHIEMGFYGLLQAYNYTEREKVGQGKKVFLIMIARMDIHTVCTLY